MAKYNEVNYIHYCLKEQKNLEIAKLKLLKLLSENKEGKGKLYALLAAFSNNLNEKREIYQKGIEEDPISPQVYWGMFTCDLVEEKYESAKENLSRYRDFMQKKQTCNTCLIEILIDEILGIEEQEYIADDYYLTTRLKGERYTVYCEALLSLQDEDYEEAYTKFRYFETLSDDLNLEPIFSLLNTVMAKRNSVFQKVKIDKNIC